MTEELLAKLQHLIDRRIAPRRLVVDYRYITDGSVFGDWDGYPKGAHDTSDISYERPLGLPDELVAAMR